MARGTGIKVVNKWNQIPKSQNLVVQRYIARPHLINNTKYDLRIYVLVTSIHPLRIYLYDEGLVRFASAEYAPDNDTLGDVFMHLTNYSINKNNANYSPNEDPDERKGHKWTLGSLWQYFTEQGIDFRPAWDKIKDMVIKTIISGEHSMFPLARGNLSSHYCSFELFGFDVLLDADFKPWLIEVNISPSLHSSSPLDLDVKSPLATEVFNIVRYHIPNKLPQRAQRQLLQKMGLEDLEAPLCFDPRVYTRDVSKADRAKQNRIMDSLGDGDWANMDRECYLGPILEKLTPDDARHLVRAEDEFARLTHFQRIFPTPDSHKYLRFFSANRYHNLLMDAWEHKYGDHRAAGIDRLERLCQEKVHLRVPQTVSSSSSSALHSASPSSSPSSSLSRVSSSSPASSSKGVFNVPMMPKTATVSSSTAKPDSNTTKKQPSFVSKPHHMCKSASNSSVSRLLRASSSSSSSKSASPEPMSVDTGSDGEDSGAKSPPRDTLDNRKVGDNDEQTSKDILPRSTDSNTATSTATATSSVNDNNSNVSNISAAANNKQQQASS